jgi:hypothetical protein
MHIIVLTINVITEQYKNKITKKNKLSFGNWFSYITKSTDTIFEIKGLKEWSQNVLYSPVLLTFF